VPLKMRYMLMKTNLMRICLICFARKMWSAFGKFGKRNFVRGISNIRIALMENLVKKICCLNSLPISNPSVNPTPSLLMPVTERNEYIQKSSEVVVECPMVDITLIADKISEMKLRKAGGHDGLQKEHVIHAGPNMVEHLIFACYSMHFYGIHVSQMIFALAL